MQLAEPAMQQAWLCELSSSQMDSLTSLDTGTENCCRRIASLWGLRNIMAIKQGQCGLLSFEASVHVTLEGPQALAKESGASEAHIPTKAVEP